MTCLGCQRCEDGPVVTLHDGRVVCNQCEDHRAECEARMIIAMPTKQKRIDYIRGEQYQKADGTIARRNGVEQKRGKASADALEALVKVLWVKR